MAVNGPGLMPQLQNEDQLEEYSSGFLDSILWMAVPKKRRTIEVNRTRRRANEKLLKVQVTLLRSYIIGTITHFNALNTDLKMYCEMPI